jgi:hypothetical protein
VAVTELALSKPDASMTPASLRVMMEAAQRYVASGLLPGEINTPQKALLVMTMGRELGVPATYALRNIHVIKGKAVSSAELMLALVRRVYGPGSIRVAKTTNDACTVQYREQGWDGISEFTFTIEDAKQAGLLGNPTWKNYPSAMLRARAISATVRFAFPECIAGLYSPDEMGAEVEVVDGEVVVRGDDRAPLSIVEKIDAETTLEDERARAITGGINRAELEAEYTRLAALAVERKHKDAARIQAKAAKDLDDDRLVGSVNVLRTWESKLPPVEEDEAF